MTRADTIIISRGHLRSALKTVHHIDESLVSATLSHAGGHLDDAQAMLEHVDHQLTALCKRVELIRLSIARESGVLPTEPPTQAEEVAA